MGPWPGVTSVSRRRGVPSIEPQVISGEASTPSSMIYDIGVLCYISITELSMYIGKQQNK